MKNKGTILGVLGLAVIGVGAYGMSAFAFQGRTGQFGSSYTAERHQQMQQAFDNNDYAAWKNQMGNRRAARVVTEQNFSRFTQMHNLMLEGKIDEANKIRTDLGLGQGSRGGQGMMGGRSVNNQEQRGQNRGENFVDANGDGICDHMQQ
jgi:hypothetical protein